MFSLESFSRRLQSVSRTFIPDPLLLAFGITAIVGVATSIRIGVGASASAWTGGLSHPGFLAFALQMCRVLITGHLLATTPLVRRGLSFIAKLPASPRAATLTVALVSCTAGFIHWGLGAVIGAFVARDIAQHARKENIAISKPTLGAAAYLGLAIWHGGLSGSAPLKVAEKGHFASAIVGVIGAERTIFSPMNLILCVLFTATLCSVLVLLTPKNIPRPDQANEKLAATESPSPPEASDIRPGEPTFVEMLFASRITSTLIALGAGFSVLLAALRGRLFFDLNGVNAIFLVLGLLLQPSLKVYADEARAGASALAAIVIQFPLYAGILSLMKSGGLIKSISASLIGMATTKTFPVVAFISAGLVNLAIPSGGGQWAVQGELLLSAGDALGVPPELTVMAFSYGDAWTNLLQPFWALPLLGILRLEAKDIIGLTSIAAMAQAIVAAAFFLLV